MNSGTVQMTLLIREIRTCFNRLKAMAEVLHSELGVNPSMRAILEALYQQPGQTVPEMAGSRGVSRQHVQKIINGLLEKELVRVEENPDHKRSVLYLLTKSGCTLFEMVQEREREPLAALTASFSDSEIATVRTSLARLNDEIEAIINKG